MKTIAYGSTVISKGNDDAVEMVVLTHENGVVRGVHTEGIGIVEMPEGDVAGVTKPTDKSLALLKEYQDKSDAADRAAAKAAAKRKTEPTPTSAPAKKAPARRQRFKGGHGAVSRTDQAVELYKSRTWTSRKEFVQALQDVHGFTPNGAQTYASKVYGK